MTVAELHAIVITWPKRYRNDDVTYLLSLNEISIELAIHAHIGKAIEQLASEGWFIRRDHFGWWLLTATDCVWVIANKNDPIIHAIDAAIRHVGKEPTDAR